MAQLPASVTIVQLPLGTTVTGVELIEAVQTSASGQANSVQLSLNQVVSGILGNPVSVPSGGTGTTALTAFGVAVGNGSSAMVVTAPGTASWPFLGNGTSFAPSFQQLNLGSSGVTGTLPSVNMTAVNLATTGPGGVVGILPVSNGGQGTSTLTPFGVMFGNGSSTVGITPAGNTALALISPGPATAPVFGQISLTAAVTGVLPVSNGGHGTSTLTAFGVVFGNGASTVGITGAAANGQILVGQNATTGPAFMPVGLDLSLSSAGTATVVGLQGRGILSTAPTTSQGLLWNGVAWGPGGAIASLTLSTGLAGGVITTTGTASINYAVKADQQGGTSTIVSVNPGVQNQHDSAAKAWVSFNGTSAAIIASYNVSGVVRNSTGDYTITFATPFASATSYIASVTSLFVGFGAAASIKSLSAATAECTTFNTNTQAGLDVPSVYVACFGRQ